MSEDDNQEPTNEEGSEDNSGKPDVVEALFEAPPLGELERMVEAYCLQVPNR